MSSEMDEIWILFADDGGQSLDAMEEALENLRDGSDDEETAHISALFRAVHTFKGNSRVLGLATVESRAHIAEDLIGLVRDDGVPLDEGILDVLFYAADTFRGMLEEVAASRQDVEPGPSEDLMDQLRETMARCTGKPVEAPAAAASDSSDEDDASDPEEPEEAGAQTPADDADQEVVASSEEEEPAQDGGDGDDNPLTAQFGDLFDSLGDSFGDDDLFEENEEFGKANEEEEEEAAAPAASPEPPKSTVEIDETPLDSKLDDAQYREIFRNMIEETVEKLESLKADTETDPNALLKKSRGKASSLSYACEQLDLTAWVNELNSFVEMAKEVADISREDLQSAITDLIAVIEEHAGEVLGVGKPKTDFSDEEEAASLFETLEKLFERVDGVGRTFVKGTPDLKDLETFGDDVERILKPYGYLHVIETATELSKSLDPDAFADKQLTFYGELVLVDEILEHVDHGEAKRPRELVQNWAAKNALTTFTSAANTVKNLETGVDLQMNFRRFARYMRIASHACHRYQITSASDLAMTLVDLFSRIKDNGVKLDRLLAHIATSFIDTLDAIFETIAQGDEPDIEEIEELFEKATNFSFNKKAKVTAREIERRLGLPESFHRVLSPESIEKAMVAIAKELRFYIVRADLNEDEKMAQAFLELVGAGTLEMITNVTVFKDDVTLFDFLVGSPLDEAALIEALSNIDPAAKNLLMTHALEVVTINNGASGNEASDIIDTPVAPAQMAGSLTMLETIGEISAGHAMIQHKLSELAEADLMQQIEYAIRDAGQPKLAPVARSAVRTAVDKFISELQSVSEAEAQLTAQLAELQDESVAMRSRPAEVLLNPLKAFVETQARRYNKEARLTTEGNNVALDQVILEELRSRIKAILDMRLSQEGDINRFHASVSREEDHVNVVIEDNGTIEMDKEAFAQIKSEFKAQNGDVKVVELLNGGVRFYISMALHMIVLDGMVVRVKDVHYVVPIDSILRIHQSDEGQVKTISAANGGRVLRMDQGEHVPIRILPGSANGPIKDQMVSDDDQNVYVIVRHNESQFAIPVDELLGQQLVLLRPLRGVLASMKDLTGIALLAGGEVGMVLAVSRLSAA